MAIAGSFLKIPTPSFFLNIPIFCVEKDFALKLGGHRESWVVIFGRGLASEGQKGGYPLKKFQIFFLKSFVNVSIG